MEEQGREGMPHPRSGESSRTSSTTISGGQEARVTFSPTLEGPPSRGGGGGGSTPGGGRTTPILRRSSTRTTTPATERPEVSYGEECRVKIQLQGIKVLRRRFIDRRKSRAS